MLQQDKNFENKEAEILKANIQNYFLSFNPNKIYHS